MQILIWIGIGYFILASLFAFSLAAACVRKSFNRRCTTMDNDGKLDIRIRCQVTGDGPQQVAQRLSRMVVHLRSHF